MGSKTKYFLAGGKTLEAARDIQAKIAARHKEWRALADEVGAEEVVTRYAVDGFTFVGNPPEGWAGGRMTDGKPFFYPHKRGKANKELRAKMAALRKIGARDFEAAIGCDKGFMDLTGFGITIRCVGFEAIGDKIIIHVPDIEGTDYTPPDSEPVRQSEYWAMREAADAKAA
jgi:hypothetical protein